MKRTRYNLLLTAIGAGLVTVGAMANEPSFTPVPETPQPVNTSATGVCGSGIVVVGEMNDPAGPGTAFSWTATGGTFRLPVLNPGDTPYVVGINHDGSVITGSSGTIFEPAEAVRWFKGTVQGLGDLDPKVPGFSSGHDVSADGTIIVGIADACTCNMAGQAFYWTEKTGMVGIGWVLPGDPYSSANGVSPDGTVIVGHGGPLGARQAFRYTEALGMQPLGDLDGGIFSSRAEAVSADGMIVVGAGWSEFGPEAFRWTPKTGMVGLGDLPGGIFASEALAVSYDGLVIGGFAETDNGGDAVVWRNRALLSVEDLLTDLGVEMGDWNLTATTDLSADGTVLSGRGYVDGVNHGWTATIPGLACASDTNIDGVTDVADLINVILGWGGDDPLADTNGDGVVDALDIVSVVTGWGPCE